MAGFCSAGHICIATYVRLLQNNSNDRFPYFIVQQSSPVNVFTLCFITHCMNFIPICLSFWQSHLRWIVHLHTMWFLIETITFDFYLVQPHVSIASHLLSILSSYAQSRVASQENQEPELWNKILMCSSWYFNEKMTLSQLMQVFYLAIVLWSGSKTNKLLWSTCEFSACKCSTDLSVGKPLDFSVQYGFITCLLMYDSSSLCTVEVKTTLM